MKETFCKIIELPTHQVLIYKDFEPEDEQNDKPVLVAMVRFDGVNVKMTMGYDDEPTRDADFIKFDGPMSQNIIDSLVNMMEGND